MPVLIMKKIKELTKFLYDQVTLGLAVLTMLVSLVPIGIFSILYSISTKEKRKSAFELIKNTYEAYGILGCLVILIVGVLLVYSLIYQLENQNY